jgi:hypothetical protein
LRGLAIPLMLVGALVSTVCSVSGQAQNQSPFDLLLRTEAVDDSAVGEVTQAERAVRMARYEAFRQLYLGGNASLSAAKRLVDSASPAGRIYGYLILRHVSPKDAAAAMPKMLQDQAPVDIRNGCIVNTSTVGELVTHIQKGYYVIQLPN